MIGCGINLSRGGRAARWTPAQLGAAAAFIARPPKSGATDRVTLSGSNILALANDGGTAGPMTSLLASSCTLDTSVTVGGYGAIRTSANTSDLKVATGGPTGSQPFHLVALAQPVSQTGAAQGGNCPFVLVGDPGNDASHKNVGIGSVASPNGLWTYIGGYQNPVAAGAAQPRMIFDTDLHVYECISDGTQILANQEGGRLGFAAGATSLSSGRMGFSGAYPLPIYGPPDTRIYWAGWFNRVLTNVERALLFKYLRTEFAYTPPRFFSATGDSITAGHIASANTTSFLEQLVLQYAGLPAAESIDIDNRGISSQTSFEIAARSPSSFVVDYAPAGYRTEYLVINGGKNDNQTTTTPAQTYANLANISVAAQAIGVKSVMTTAFYGTPAAMTPQDYIWVDQLNALIRANSCGANYVVDYYVDPILANPTSAHWPDNVHPDNVGCAAMATCIRNVVG